VKLPEDVLSRIDAHAVETFPCEACGLLVQRADETPVYRPCDNTADNDPVVDNMGRQIGPMRAYRLDPTEVLRAEREGLAMLAIVHSHPGGDARFSAVDRSVATSTSRDGLPIPTWPDVLHLVVGVAQTRVTERRWYGWDPAGWCWSEVPA